MTDTERQNALKAVEKGPHQSKKFLAWLIQQIIMGTMAIVALIKQPNLDWPLASFMVGIVFMMGISTMWYLGKQTATDIAVRGFALVGGAPQALAKKFGVKPQEEESTDG